MTMYKIINDFCVRKLHDEYPKQIPRDEMNADYIQFKKDVVGIGTTCVEGADYAGITTYTRARETEYPSWNSNFKIWIDKFVSK